MPRLSSLCPLIAARLPTSAPEQNAGGAPVTTSAPTPSSTSSSSTATTISPTSPAVSAFLRSGSSSVSTATRSRRSTCSGNGLRAVSNDGRRMSEERLHIPLVAIRGAARPDRTLEPEAARELVDRASRRVLVAKAPLLEARVVDTPSVAEEGEHLGRQVDRPCQS